MGRRAEGGGGGGAWKNIYLENSYTCPLDFSLCRFCILAKTAIRPVFPPFLQIPMYLLEKILNILRRTEKLGGGGERNKPTPSWEGSKIVVFPGFEFSFVCFCHKNEQVSKLLET